MKNMFNPIKKIKKYFFEKKFICCYDQVKSNRYFFTSNVLSPEGMFKNYPLEIRFKIYEEEVLTHLPEGVYSIYKKKYGEGIFVQLLIKDAFGTDSIYNEHVEDFFKQNCMKA